MISAGIGEKEQPRKGAGFTFTPVIPQWNYPVNSGMNMSVKGNMEDKATQKHMMGGQIMQGVGMIASATFQGLNTWLAAKSMDHQASLAGKQLDVNRDIAGYQKEVALKQLGVQQEGMHLQNDMHQRQVRSEEKLAKWQHGSDARKLQISENAKTSRMKIASVTDAFSRRGMKSDYNYGSSYS
jgi:hypothetical protein